MDYKKAGVNIEAGELLVEKIKPAVAATRTAGVLSDIGLFGGFFDARFPDYRHPVLVASTDGVGTKLKIAIMANRHDTVGQCLVNHCVNDILACGARPLFFLDYYATGALNADVAADVITGIATACKQNDCAVLGGETAEMPSIYANDDYDVAGTIVGIVEKDSILNGSRVEVGNVLIGLPSAGLHTNGYSLARKALFPRYDIHDHVAELGGSLADALLAVHTSYLHPVAPLLNDNLITAISHITGGGILGNTKRILQPGQQLRIDWGSWHIPAIFTIIQRAGSIAEAEMRHVFNLGVGIILVVHKGNVDAVLERLSAHHPFIVGEVVGE